MPTAAPWADVACRGSRDGRPHRPRSKYGHRSRRSGKPTGSVSRSLSLPSCVLQLPPLSPAQAARTTRGRPQLRPQDWIRSQTPGSPPVRRSQCRLPPSWDRCAGFSATTYHAGKRQPDIRCGRTSRGRPVPVIDGRQPGTPAGRPLITSSGRHIMRRSVRQAPSSASTRPPRRPAGLRALPDLSRLIRTVWRLVAPEAPTVGSGGCRSPSAGRGACRCRECPAARFLVALESNAGSGVKALIARSAGAALAARPDRGLGRRAGTE